MTLGVRSSRVGAARGRGAVARCPECGESYGAESRFCGFDGATLMPGDADPASTHLLGRVIDRRYEIVSLLGEGGMGTVYKVRHTTLERHFAMKVLKKGLAEDAKLAERFIVEAKATASVKHASVVAITDFGHLDDRRPYFVMELLGGQTLADALRAGEVFEPARAARIVVKVARALSAAHEAGIIHRDMKPENVVLVGSPSEDDVKVVDFGAALVVGAKRNTKAGVVFGTPHFMSPEQASGSDIDHRADIYSLGVVMYEVLTGQVPFDGDVYHEVLRKHLIDPPRPPTATVGPARAAAIRALEPIVLKALAKDPDERYLTAEALAQDIERAAQGLPLAGAPARGTAVLAVARPEPAPKGRPRAVHKTQRSPQHPRLGLRGGRVLEPKTMWTLAAGGVVVALLALVLLARSLVRERPRPERPAGASAQPLAVGAATSPPTAPTPPKAPAPEPTSSATVEPRNVAPAGSAKAPASTRTQGGGASRPPSKADEFRDPWTK